LDTIIVPVDGATNIKLEVLDFDTLKTVYSRETGTPSTEVDGLLYNNLAEECSWFDRSILDMPDNLRTVKAIAPVARGASGGFVGPNNTLVEVPGEELTLAYTQLYPERVEEAFYDLAGNATDFFLETGSVMDFPGSVILLKRFLFEEMERPDVLDRAECFGTYGSLLSGHFLGDNFLYAARIAGNEHSYWMCHTGARNINGKPGTPSSLSTKTTSFQRMVTAEPTVAYIPIDSMPYEQADVLRLYGQLLVTPGGHDTCMSHIPVMSTYYRAFEDTSGTPVLHVDAGSWTMVAQIGGKPDIPADGYKRDIIVQGTVDGHPVVTARYGGGNDFGYIQELAAERGCRFCGEPDEKLLEETARAADCFVLPNINPVNHKTGPFPGLKGKIINELSFFSKPERAYIIANLTTALTTAHQIEAVTHDTGIPLVITAGGSKDPYFGRLLATITGRSVYALEDSDGSAVTETTTLGAAIAGKAANIGIHPYDVDVSALGITYRNLPPFTGEVSRQIKHYRERFMEEIERNIYSN